MYNIKLVLTNITKNHKITLGNESRQCLGSLLFLFYLFLGGWEGSLLFLYANVREVLSGEVTFEKKPEVKRLCRKKK